MPVLGGLELCRRLREQGPAGLDGPVGTAESRHVRYTHLILVTAHDSWSDALVGMQAGADDYLSKPVSSAQLELRLIAAQRVTDLHRSLERQQQDLVDLGNSQHALARRDPLTGLPNRRALQEDLDRLHARVSRHGRGFSVAMFDIDHFKSFNDTAGHLEGDRVLERVADALSSRVRSTDGLYRYGGEEFALLLDTADRVGAHTGADRLRPGRAGAPPRAPRSTRRGRDRELGSGPARSVPPGARRRAGRRRRRALPGQAGRAKPDLRVRRTGPQRCAGRRVGERDRSSAGGADFCACRRSYATRARTARTSGARRPRSPTAIPCSRAHCRISAVEARELIGPVCLAAPVADHPEEPVLPHGRSARRRFDVHAGVHRDGRAAAGGRRDTSSTRASRDDRARAVCLMPAPQQDKQGHCGTVPAVACHGR